MVISNEERNWRASRDAEVLMEAEMIRKDASRMSAAQDVAAEKKAALDAIAGDAAAQGRGRVTMVEKDGAMIPSFE